MATQEQLDSRKRLAEFVQAVGKPLRGLANKAKSAWFGRPDDELKGWIERGRAISDIQDSLGYKLIMNQVDLETAWALNQMRICDVSKIEEFRMYLRSMEFLKDFILTTNRNADIATGVLAGRESAIGRDSDTFIKNARTDG
jgi:hypothetical protein